MEKQIDYAEQLLEAMKVVSQAEVQGVQFDRTIQCTVTGIEDAENGIYTVNNGSASFIAYSKDTDYKVKDNVLVTIPQGDYNQQKIIIGKYITKNSTPFVYKSPFDYFVDITGNLVSNSHGEYSILANDITNDLICPEGPVAYWSCLGSQNESPLVGYDTIGLKADFMSLLKGFKVVSGNYGLRVLVTYLNEANDVADTARVNQVYADALETYSQRQQKILNLLHDDRAAKESINAASQEVYGVDIAKQLMDNLQELGDRYYKQGAINEEQYLAARNELIDTASIDRQEKIAQLDMLHGIEEQYETWRDSINTNIDHSNYTSEDYAATYARYQAHIEAIEQELNNEAAFENYLASIEKARQELNNLMCYSQKAYYLDIDDMYGDPYDFDTYYEQQILFDISDIDNIVSIQVDLYQSWDTDEADNMVGSFKNVLGERILPYDEVFNDELYMDNIYVKDIYLALGYNESQFDTDKLLISTRNNNTYSSIQENDVNKKVIIARWIHKDDKGEIFIIDDLSQVPGAKLNWYRYKLSAPAADIYSGVYWIKLSTTDDQNFYAKVINDGWGCELLPNPDLQDEKIKAILVYGQNKIIRSNQLTFTNEIEVPSGATARKLDDFYLVAEDGLSGVYNLYDNNHKILERTTNDDGSPLTNEIHPQNQRRRLLTKLKDSDLQDIEYIKWSIPYQYTMLDPVGINKELLFKVIYDESLHKYKPIINTTSLVIDAENNISWLTDYDDDYVYLMYPLNNRNPSSITDYNKIPNFDWSFHYKIKDTLVKSYTNNGVTCEIVKDRVVYSYTFNFRFGYNGTNGSDYTLMLSYASIDDKKMPETALQVDGDNNNPPQLKIHLDIMDQKGNLLDWHNKTIFDDVQIKWDWITCISRQSYNNYKPTYEIIDHDNIPQYRKDLKKINGDYIDTNDTEDVSDDITVPPAIPTFYLEGEMVNNEPTYTSDLGPYSDQKDSVGRYLNNYLVQVFNKNVSSTPHITLHDPNLPGQTYNNTFKTYLQDIILKATSSLTMDELYVLEVTVQGLVPYNLVSYIPISLYKVCNGMKPEYIGPDMVRYNSLGETDFYKDPCKIMWNGSNDDVYDVPPEAQGVVHFERFIPLEGTPGFTDGEDTQDYGVLNDQNVLEPLNVYLDDNPPYGIQYFIGSTVYYTQPIFCYLNQWPNGTVNKWDGTGLLINEEAGYIMGHSITAGKKERDNTFTGVMLGDLGVYDNTESELTKTTGVYGFHHGAISYALKDDGTALVGKAGHGRIEFDGNKGTIKSSSWTESNNPHGMLIDLDDGIIKMAKPGFYEVVEMTSDIVNDFNSEKENLYRQVLYKLYDIPRDNYSQIDYNQYNYDLDQLTFYLPNSFYTHTIPVTSSNYIANKFYIETIEGPFTDGLENEVVPNPPQPLAYISGSTGNNYLIDATFSTTYINRVNLETGSPRFVLTLYGWTYVLNNNQLVPILSSKINYIYTLATGDFVNNVTYVLPENGNFTEITADELAAWNFEEKWFYTLVGDYVSCKNDTKYDIYETYYHSGGGDRYITVTVDHSTYPLSIGRSASETSRKFRVNWDGYVFAEHGRFTGTIQAKDGYLKNLEITGQLIAQPYTPKRNKPGIYGAYIEGSRIEGAWIIAEEFRCDYGELGGWNVDDKGLYNDAWGNGTSNRQGQVYLNSKNNGINIKNSTISFESTGAEIIGPMLVGVLGTDAFGLSYNAGTLQENYYNMTSAHRALYFNRHGVNLEYCGGYNTAWFIVGYQDFEGRTAIYGTSDTLSLTNVESIDFSTNGVFDIQISSQQSSSSAFSVSYTDSNSSYHRMFEISRQGITVNIPAAYQHGIYARFA